MAVGGSAMHWGGVTNSFSREDTRSMQLYPGMNDQHSLISRQFFRCAPSSLYVRHNLRVWESSTAKGPRLKDESGAVLFGDDPLADWRKRTRGRAVARVRAYLDVHPDR
ncbi:MAG: hypothetical protein JJE39_07300 [Vicinamibacteria bacterium]|nr:hypothetical protein [Vicinamibacteria bacterium]